MNVLAAIIGLIILVGIMAWAYAKSQATAAKETERRRILQEGADARDAMDDELAQPIPAGRHLIERMRDRASRAAAKLSDS